MSSRDRNLTEEPCNLYILTCLRDACATGRLEIVDHLITKYNLNPSQRYENGTTPLHVACGKGHVKIVRYLVVNKQCDPNSADNTGMTCLHTASLNGEIPIIELLVSLGSDPNCKTADGMTPLHIACLSGRIKVVKYLTKNQDFDPNIIISNGFSFIHLAGMSGDVSTAKYLIETLKCNLNITTSDGVTPLHLACGSGHIEMVQYFDSQRCDFDSISVNGWSGIHYACSKGHLHIIKYLLHSKYSFKEGKTQTFMDPLWRLFTKQAKNVSPLSVAASHGQYEVVKHLIENHQLDPTAYDSNNLAPLHQASVSGNLELVRYLIERCKCDPLITNSHRTSPLSLAIQGNHQGIVKYYFENLKFDLKFWDGDRSSPHTFAALVNRLEIYKYLDTLDDIPNITRQRFTALDSASLMGHLNIIQYILSIDTRVLAYKDEEDRQTAWHTAASAGHLEIIKYFAQCTPCDYNTLLDNKNRSPLHSAAQQGRLEVVKFLVGSYDPEDDYSPRICDPFLKDNSGWTPASMAMVSFHRDVRAYLKNVADVESNFQTSIARGYSPVSVLNILVVGNSKAGKSTLVKALSSKSYLDFIYSQPVKDVQSGTVGIVPSEIKDPTLGKLKIYDFAGEEEYHASHEVILQQIHQPFVILVFDLSLPIKEIEKQYCYWSCILSNAVSRGLAYFIDVVIVGSHADVVKDLDLIKTRLAQIISNQEIPRLQYCGVTCCDCRYSKNMSDIYKRLELARDSIFNSPNFLSQKDASQSSNILGTALLYFLQFLSKSQFSITLSSLHKKNTSN